MAYEQNWNPKNKMPEKDAIDFLSSQVIEITDNAFHIRKESDDGGTTLSIYVEMNEDGTKGYENRPIHFDELRGWRVVWVTCPPRYTNKWRNQ